jgi:hypothetical protein
MRVLIGWLVGWLVGSLIDHSAVKPALHCAAPHYGFETPSN